MSNIEKYNGVQIQTIDEAMRYAEAMSGAGMIPRKFQGQPANVLVAQEIAHTLQESTWMVMSELYFVGQVPTFSAKFMRSRIRNAGHKLRESYDKETGTARAVIIRADDPEFEHVAEWDEEKARKHDLWGKNHWLKNPELMLKNRALSEVMREACYEVMGGIAYTPDEAKDFVKMDARRMDQGAQDSASSAQQGAPQAQGGPQPQQAAPKLPTAQEWAAKLMDLEAAGELEKVAANMKWAQDKGHGELFTMARSVHDRMMAAVHASQEGEQQVFEAEVVTEEKVAA